MQMPSLVKYFAFVGMTLLALLSFANFLLEPSTGATKVATPAKPAVVVRHDPGASKVERWRNEQAALKAAEQAQTAQNASLAAKSTMEPLRPAISPATEPAIQTAAASLATPADAAENTPTAEQAAAEAARLEAEKAEKAKAAAKAKKARQARAKAERLTRERDIDQFFNGTQQRTASNQQDAYYYGQRAPQQRQGYAYAPQQSYGPFGFGRGW